MKQKLLNKLWLRVGMIVAIMTTALAGTAWANEGDELAICQGTGSGYGTRRTLTDVYSVGWVLASGQSGYLGANNATNHDKVKPTAADLPVVKAVKSDATTSTTGYYFYYTTTAVANVGGIEFSYTANSGNSSATAYVVVGDALSASGGDAYEVIELSSTSTTAQNASLGTSGTFTYTFNETQTSARFYGFIIVTSSFKRLTAGTIKLIEGATGNTPTCATPTFSPAAGAVVSGTTVSISSTEGATIYYTTNGTTPSSSSSVYSSPIEITAATTIKAFASKSGYDDSDVATAAYTIKPTVIGYTIDFESDLDAYVDWTFTNIGTSNTAIDAHNGSKYGANINDSGNGVSTASIQTKETIALPGSFTCYVSKVSTNATSSTWTLDVSEDGTTWTEVATQEAAVGITKGEWTEFTANISGYSDVYVRLSYGSSNAIRAIDDISITMRDPNAKVTPTVTIDASGITTTDLANNTNVAAGTLAATVASGETTINTPAVTWSSSDTGVATVNATTGAVTLIAVGTTTITATFAGNDDYTEATDTYELTVINTYAKGQVNNPYIVAEAIDAIDNDGNVTDVYVCGIVCTGGSSLSSGALTYWISDDGTETDKFEIYRGKGISNANFTSTDDIQVGDVVVVRGNITLYNSTTYEFSSGSQLVSLSRKDDSDLAAIGNINLSMASPETTADATAYFTTSSTGAISYESGNTSVATVNAAGVVTPVAAGTTTITVTQAADADYKAGEITINVIVAVASLNSTTIAANASGSTTYGTPKEESYMIDETYDGTIAAVSSNPAVATVAIIQHTDGEGTFTITPVAVGTAVITISAPATATCEAADNATYTIIVTAPAGGTTAAPASTNLFVERFNAAEGSGPSGDSWSGTTADGEFASDNDGWTSTSNRYAGAGCARFGTSKANGDATTPAISFDPSVTYTLTFKAGAWNNDGTTLTLSCDDDDAVLGQTSFTMVNNSWTEYETTVKAASGSKLTFTTSSKRFFLDDVVVKTAGVDLSVTLNGSGYATFCSQYPLDFSDYATADYSAWQITAIDKSAGTITFSQIKGSVKGGTGILLKGPATDPRTTITLTSDDSENELDDNLLYGTLARTYVAADTYYGLSGNTFVKVNAGTVPAGKALLSKEAVEGAGGGVKAFTFVFEDDATGIEETLSNSPLKGENIYNLAGQMVNGKSVNGKLPKGIYIVNGKKIMY